MRNDLKRAPNILVIQLNHGLAGGKKNPTVVDVASQSFVLPREKDAQFWSTTISRLFLP